MGLNKALAFSCMSLMLVFAGAAKADTFSNGQFVTYGQGDWGQGGVADPLLTANYDSVYASTSEVLIVGSLSPGLFAMAFTGAGASDVLAYIPSLGIPGPLTASLTNPTSSPSGIFGGDVVALTLDVDFNNAGFLHGTSTLPFGNLVLTNLSSFVSPGGTFDLSALNGLTVSQFLADANTCLGGGLCPGSLDAVDGLTEDLLGSFDNGTVSTFADTNLALPSSVTTAPEPSSLLLLAPGLAGLGFLRRRRSDGRLCKTNAHSALF
jgi:hypothetical protein